MDSLNNIYVSGDNRGFGRGQMYLIKYDNSGIEKWSRTVKNSYYGKLAIDTSDYVYLAGTTYTNDIYLVKYNNSGIEQWSLTWGGINSEDCGDITVDSSGNIYVAGTIWDKSVTPWESSFFLVKFDASGVELKNITWNIGPRTQLICYAIALDSTGNIYLGGVLHDHNTFTTNLLLVKFNADINKRWHQTWEGWGGEFGNDIAIDLSDNILVCGTTMTNDMILMKYESSGNPAWVRPITWDGGSNEFAHAIAIDPSNSIYLAGVAGGGDMCLVKYDPLGSEQWNLIWGGKSSEWCLGIAFDAFQNIYLAGFSTWSKPNIPDIILVKYKKAFLDLSGVGIYINDLIPWGANSWAKTASKYVWCSGSGTVEDPYVIKNVFIDGRDSRSCIVIHLSRDKHFIIKNCIVYNSKSDSHAGIRLVSCSNGKLIDNDCSDNRGHGIHLEHCDRIAISENVVNNNEDSGIKLTHSDRNTISNNLVNENGLHGMNLEGGRNNISGNDIKSNGAHGIYLGSWGGIVMRNIIKYNELSGIRVYDSDDSDILANVIENNGQDGIYFESSSRGIKISDNYINKNGAHGISGHGKGATITGNTISENGGRGIYLESLRSWIFNNYLSKNTISNAYDHNGILFGEDSNKWDNGSIGNFWDDYEGFDLNKDGIGDSPYFIPATYWMPQTYWNRDNFPIVIPDFAVNKENIYFEKGGGKTTVLTTIKNVANNYGGEINVSFYDEDEYGNIALIGNKTFVNLYRDEPKNVSIEWLPQIYHKFIVRVDPKDRIFEPDESNNIAIKGAGGHRPIIQKVTSEFGVWKREKYHTLGTFITGIKVDNTFFVEVDDLDGKEDIYEVVFEVGDERIEATEKIKGVWECTLNMGDLETGNNKLEIIAYDEWGFKSETRIINIEAIKLPEWILKETGPIPDTGEPSWLEFIKPDEISISFAIELELPNRMLPEKIATIGGKEVSPKIEIEFTLTYDIATRKTEFTGSGNFIFEIEVSEYKSYEIGVSLEVTGKLDENLELEELDISIGFRVKFPIWGAEKTFKKDSEDFKLTIGVGVDCELRFLINIAFDFVEEYINFYISVHAALIGYAGVKIDFFVAGAEFRAEARGALDFIYGINSVTKETFVHLTGTFEISWTVSWWVGIPPWTVKESFGGKYKWEYEFFSPATVNETIIEEPTRLILNETVLMDSRPRIAADNNGNATMVWTQNRNDSGVIYTDICYSMWNGTDWGDAEYVTFDKWPDFDPVLTYDSNGNVMVIWSRITGNISKYEPDNLFDIFETQEITYSIWDGSAWSAPRLITNDTHANGRAVVSATPDGKLMAIWNGDIDHNLTTSEDMELFYSVWNGTNWSSKLALTNYDFLDYSASLAHDSQGNAIVSWIRDLDGNWGTTLDTELMYAIWNGTDWSSSINVIEVNESKRSPSITFDLNDNALITWVGSNENFTKLYFAMWNKTTKKWSTPEVVRDDDFFIYHPAINVDPNNTAVIVWRGFEDDEEERGYYFTHNTTETYFDGEICYATKDLNRPDSVWSEVKYLTSDNKTDWMASAVIIRGHSNDLLLVWDQAGNVSNLVHEIKPDLTLSSSDITFSNQYPNEGEEITITATIYNKGDVEAKDVDVRFYNGDPYNGGILIGNYLIGSLDYDEKVTVSIPWNVESGTNNIYVNIDPLDSVSEILEGNNIAFNSIDCLPDLFLSPEDISFSKLNPQEGETITINATILNQGGTATNYINVSFYSNDTYIGSEIIQLLNATDYTTISMDWIVTGGYNNITIVIDPSNQIFEWNENNNWASTPILILPDLEIVSFNISENTIILGESIEISTEIRNLGKAGANKVEVEYFDGNPYINGTLIAKKTINIPLGETILDTLTWTPSAGVHQVFVVVDRINKFVESNESNNLKYNELLVKSLVDLGISESDLKYELDSIKVSLPIKNLGDSGVTNVLVHLYDGNPATGGILLKKQIILHISAKQNETVVFLIDKPPLYEYFSIIVDPENSILEIDEENNQIMLNYADIPKIDAGPDLEVNEGDFILFSAEILAIDNLEDYNFYWDFGDGSIGIGINAIHQYGDDGNYVVNLMVTGPDLTGSDKLEVKVNNVAPTVNAGLDQVIVEGETFSFDGKFSDPGWLDTHTIEWQFGDGFTASSTLTPTHSYDIPGTYEVTLKVTDDDGGVGSDTCTVIVLDKTAPVTTILLSGTPGLESWYVSDVIVLLLADDEFSGVAKTAYSFDGITWTEYTIPFPITTEGENTIYYNSTDLAGNVELTQTKTIKIDKTKPVTILSYVQESGVGSIVTLSSSDLVSGVTSIAYSLDGITWESYTTPFTLSTGGIVQVYYNATDIAGNVESTKMDPVVVDIFPPVTIIELEGSLGLNSWYISNVNVTLTATDDLMGVDVIIYSLDGMTWTEYTGPFTKSDEGLTTIYYRAVDNADNIENVKTETIKIDKTPPETVLTLQGTSGFEDWFISDVNIILESTDGTSGVAEIEYSYDSILWFSYIGPFIVNAEGITELFYRSSDNAGNIEEMKSVSIKIDKSPPDIAITPSSQTITDGDPVVIFSWNVYDMSTIISLDIRLNDLIISNDPTGVYSIINEIGVYNLSIYAEDIHGLSNFVFSKIEIIDDDICPPELSNLVITHDIHNVNISFDAIDQSGIEDTIILVNGEIIEPISQTKAGHTYFFTLENQWILKNGIYEVEIQVKDADNDRPNDDLSSSIIGIFEITLKDMYEYVDWQLEELQKYITENLCWIFRWILNRKLLHAQEHLEEAYCLSESGKITSGLFHDIVAKIILRITEFRTEIFNKINFINNEDAEYIINSIHTIRNNIVILMGASVGTEQAYNIALIEVKLLNLNDFIEEELNWWISRCVRNHISSAARYLECAIFKLSINADIDCALTKAQWKLEMAECKIKCLLKRGKISQDLADNLLQKIEDVQTDIEKVKNLI